MLFLNKLTIIINKQKYCENKTDTEQAKEAAKDRSVTHFK